MLSHEYAMPAFDLVKSLRTHARDRDRDAWMNCEEAADEIERLRKENQELKLQYLSDQGQWIEETGRLREALHKVLGIVGNFPVDRFEYNVIKEARAALKQAQPVAAREKETV